MPFPSLPPLIAAPGILLSQGVTSLTFPDFGKPERTAVSAVTDCCKWCFQGCSEEAEKEVSWVLNLGTCKAGKASCCSRHFNIWCNEGLCLRDLLSAAATCAVCCRSQNWSPVGTRPKRMFLVHGVDKESDQAWQPPSTQTDGAVQMPEKCYFCSDPKWRETPWKADGLFIFIPFPLIPHSSSWDCLESRLGNTE